MTEQWAPRHQGTPDGACTCDHEGFLARLSCGDESWSHGAPPVGGYVTCGVPGFAHQSSYKVLSVRPGRPGD